MARKMQGQHIDGYFELDFSLGAKSMFITIQAVPYGETSVATTWWVSGLGELWMPYLLLKLELTLPYRTKKSFEQNCKELAISYVAALAEISARSGGMVAPAPENSPEVSESLALMHFSHHMNTPRFSEATDSMETGTLYLMAKAFGVKNPVRYVADHFNVGVTTITKRLTRHRDSGFIPKSRVQ